MKDLLAAMVLVIMAVLCHPAAAQENEPETEPALEPEQAPEPEQATDEAPLTAPLDEREPAPRTARAAPDAVQAAPEPVRAGPNEERFATAEVYVNFMPFLEYVDVVGVTSRDFVPEPGHVGVATSS
jgi:hypothetical protein